MRRTFMKSVALTVLIIVPMMMAASFGYVSAAPYENWGSAPTTNPSGDRYSQYILFSVYKSGDPIYWVPMEINPTFPDRTCNASSLRILYLDDSNNYIELPYQNTTAYSYYASKFLNTVNLTFIAPKIASPTNFRLYWSYNNTINAPGYVSTDFRNITAPSVTDYYYGGAYHSSINLEFKNSGSNILTSILIKKIQPGFDYTFLSSEMEYSGAPEFNETSAFQQLDLGAGFRNKGPISIKMTDDTTSGWGGSGTTKWVVVGTHNSTILYNFTSGDSKFTYVTNYTFSGTVNCNGIAFGKVVNTARQQLLVGLSNGSVMIMDYNPTTRKISLISQFTDTTNARKAWGIGVDDISQFNAAGQSEVILASDKYGDNVEGYITAFNESTTDGFLEEKLCLSPDIPAAFVELPNMYGPNLYVGNFLPDTDFPNNEFLMATKYGTNLVFVMGKANHTVDGNINMKTNGLYTGSYAGDNWYYYPVGSIGTIDMSALAYSQKLVAPGSNYTIVSGTSMGMLNWYNMTYDSGVKRSGILLDGQYNIGRTGALLPVVGNFDNVDTTYDDVAVVSSNGYLYFFRVDASTKKLQFVNEQLIATGVDFAGIGQSVLKADLVGDAKEEIIVAGNDGRIRVLSAAFPADIRIDISIDGDDEVSDTGSNTYSLNSLTNFATEINDLIEAETYDEVELYGTKYIKIPINITTSSRGIIKILSLNVTYNTSDYSSIDTNVGFQPYDTDLSSALHVDLDLDADDYPDVYEYLNVVRTNGTTVRVYLNNDGTYTTLSNGDPLPVEYKLDPYNPDSDGDGLIDGREIKWWFTNPNDQDTDNDGITDWDELQGPFKSLLGTLCVIHPDYDGDTLNDLIEISNNGHPRLLDTDSDGLNDTVEYFIYHSNMSKTDSDDDGLPDLLEAGKSYYILNNSINSRLRYYQWKLDGSGLNLSDSDSDNDGLDDYDEIFGIEQPRWNDPAQNMKYYTDPTKADTDSDTISDSLEVLGRSVTWRNWTLVGSNYVFNLVNQNFRTNPTSNDTDNDYLLDAVEVLYFTIPTIADTDRDGLRDGDEALQRLNYGNILNLALNATNPDTDGDGLTDGVEYYGIGYVVGFRSNPTATDTDGDTWSDYREVMEEFTNPDNDDSDFDGIRDDIDPYPMLSNLMTILTYILVGFGMITGIATYPINKRAAKVATRAKVEYQKKIERITGRLSRERTERDRVTAFARMMPSNLSSGKINVKVNVRINDESFYVRQVKLWFSAGADEFREVMMDKMDDMNYSVVLANIPLDMTVLYYMELLDKGGVWVKQLKDEVEQKAYEFSTSKDGLKEASDWDDEHLTKCDVCGYMCQKTWEKCPECNTPLHDTTQEIFAEDQKKKEEALAKQVDEEESAWEEAQQTDEVWRGLPECPSCGFTVQPDWARCPVCNFDLTAVELKGKTVYDDVESDMDAIEDKEHVATEEVIKPKSAKEVKKEIEETQKKEKKKSDDEWGSGGGNADIL